MSALWLKIPWLGFGAWWPVLISDFSAYARQWQNMATGVQSLRISLRIHHNGNFTAPVSVSVTGLTGHPNEITCCALRFVE